jgi:hypothetical protein
VAPFKIIEGDRQISSVCQRLASMASHEACAASYKDICHDISAFKFPREQHNCGDRRASIFAAVRSSTTVLTLSDAFIDHAPCCDHCPKIGKM